MVFIHLKLLNSCFVSHVIEDYKKVFVIKYYLIRLYFEAIPKEKAQNLLKPKLQYLIEILFQLVNNLTQGYIE